MGQGSHDRDRDDHVTVTWIYGENVVRKSVMVRCLCSANQ